VRVLFVTSHHGLACDLESTLRLLADRGHGAQLVSDTAPLAADPAALCAEFPRKLTYDTVVSKQAREKRYAAAHDLRRAAEYLHSLIPAYDTLPLIRARARARAPHLVRALVLASGGERSPLCPLIARAVAALEGALPGRVPDVLGGLEHHRPDLLVVAPGIAPGSMQADYLRWARARGIPSSVVVTSLFALATEGMLHEQPDIVFVWNEGQCREAVERHGLQPERVVVTGSPAADRWIDDRPLAPREEVCARLGVDPTQPYVLYLASAGTPAAAHAWVWVRRLREESDPEVCGLRIVVCAIGHSRPAAPSIDGTASAAFARPDEDDDFRAAFEHAAAAVTLDGTGVIEAAATGVPLLTVATAVLAAEQEQLLRTPHIRVENGGPLSVADSWIEHGADLAAVARGTAARETAAALARPAGDETAAEVFVRALEAASVAAPAAPPRRPGPLRRLLVAVVAEFALARMKQAAYANANRVPPAMLLLVLGWTDDAGGGRWLPTVLRQPARVLARGALSNRLIRRLVLAIVRCALRVPPLRAFALSWLAPLVPGWERRIGELSTHEGRLREMRSKNRELARARVLERLAARERDRFPTSGRRTPVQDLVAELDELATSGQPVIAGPWLGTVGFELLYWIPFLRWATERHPQLAERLVVVSRGGVGSWYSGIGRYIDITELFAYPREAILHQASAAEIAGAPRPLEPDDLSVALLRDAGRLIGTGDARPLWPAHLYRTYHREKKRNQLDALELLMRRVPLEAPAATLDLPSEFIAVGALFTEVLPTEAAVIARMRALVEELSIDAPVVQLAADPAFNGFFPAPLRSGRIAGIPNILARWDLLAVQAETIARSRLFVGPLGGLTAIAAFSRVPSVGLHVQRDLLEPWPAHVLKRLEEQGFGRVTPVDLADSGAVARVRMPAGVVTVQA
jgi:hypothetical protein